MFDWFYNVLAAWRLAHLIVHEDGPWDVFVRLRYLAGVRWIVQQGASGPEPLRVATTSLARGLTCLWCVSVWTAALLRWRRLEWLKGVLAVSAGAVLLDEAAQMWRRQTP